MIEAFAKSMPNESVVWLSGTVKDGIGVVKKCWQGELEYSSPTSAETKASWLFKFVENLMTYHPDQNLVILAHRHPIGSNLSQTDVGALKALADWNADMYWLMIACDIQLACYEPNQISSVAWEVGKNRKKKADSWR